MRARNMCLAKLLNNSSGIIPVTWRHHTHRRQYLCIICIFLTIFIFCASQGEPLHLVCGLLLVGQHSKQGNNIRMQVLQRCYDSTRVSYHLNKCMRAISPKIGFIHCACLALKKKINKILVITYIIIFSQFKNVYSYKTVYNIATTFHLVFIQYVST